MKTDASAAPAADAGAHGKKRLFLSYGHDAFEELAARLVQDLHATGRYEVWFDKHNLTPGTEWEHEIEKGLTWVAAGPSSGWVILLMTPHSVRRPKGYCLKEVRFALDRDIAIVPIMVISVELPISINTYQYLDMTDCVPVLEKAANYERKFTTLCTALETHGLAVADEANRLRRALRPGASPVHATYDFSRFVERRGLIRQFDEWVANLAGPQVFWVTGPLGSGKSTLAAWLSEHRSAVKAFHVCGRLDLPRANHRDAVRSIAWQLATQLPGYREKLDAIGELETICRDPDVDLLDRLIVQPMHGLAAPETPVVVLIDALDEAAAADVNTLAELLGREMKRLPPWLRFALTSGPDSKVTVPLQEWSPVEIDNESDENREEILEYVEKHIACLSPTRTLESSVLQRLLAASECNWLYLDWVRRALEQHHLTFDTVDSFPQGLGGACHYEFMRRFPDRDGYRQLPRAFLSVLAAAGEPLSIPDYARVLKRPESDVRDIVRDLGGLVGVRGDRVRPFHYALVAWLVDEAKSGAHSVSVSDGHRCLAEDGWSQFKQDPGAMRPYACACLPLHLLELGQLDRLERCVTDALFIAGRVSADNLYDLARYWKAIPPTRLRQLCDDSLNALMRRGGDDAVVHAATIGTGQLFQQAGLYEAAIAFFEKALQAAQRTRDAGAIGQAELNIGWCLRHVDEFERAVEHATAAIAHFRKGASREGRARGLSVRGICRWHLREDLAALDDLRDAVSLYQEAGDDRSRAEALNHLGIVRRSLGMYEEALACLWESRALSTRFKDARELGKCLNSLGTACWWKGDRDLALDYYLRADRANEAVNQPYVLGLTANNRGYVYLEEGLYRQAYESFRRAREIHRKLRIVSYEMMDVSGMALASYHLQRLEEARELSRLAVTTLRQFRVVEDLERAYYNHFVITSRGNAVERAEGARGLHKALGLIEARMRNIRDEEILARYRAVPLVTAILEAAGAAQAPGSAVAPRQAEAAGHGHSRRRRRAATRAAGRSTRRARHRQ